MKVKSQPRAIQMRFVIQNNDSLGQESRAFVSAVKHPSIESKTGRAGMRVQRRTRSDMR